MKSNYKHIGDFIRLVDKRNHSLQVTTLLGLSIDKKFIPSVANTVGSDMSNYKIISQGQFACSLMQVRRDKKLPIALLDDLDEAIISQAYPVFEIKDKNTLLPEYLMMWVSRTEFDRHACFLAVGGVRGSLEWEDFCEMPIPVPSIEKQKEIVCEYNTIVERIKLNEQLCQKLEEAAQALYKHWFVDFEFPISKEYAESMGKPELEGKPYKSSGGEMVFNSDLDKRIPLFWKKKKIRDYCLDMKSGGTPQRDNEEYWATKDIPWLKTSEVANCVIVKSEEYISYSGLKNSSAKLLPINSVLIAMYGDGKTKGQVGFLKFEATTNQACCAMICHDEVEASFLYYYLRFNSKIITNQANGGAQENLSKNLIEKFSIITPDRYLFSLLPFRKFINLLEDITKQNILLNNSKYLILQRMTNMGH